MKAYAERYGDAGGVVYQIDEADYVRLPTPVRVNNDPIGYLRFTDGRLLHRWLLGLDVGDPRLGDHINKNVYDNRMSNLRIVTPTESNFNRRTWNKWGLPSGIKLAASGRYQSTLAYEGERYYLGTHDTVEDAVAARERQLEEILRGVKKRVSP